MSKPSNQGPSHFSLLTFHFQAPRRAFALYLLTISIAFLLATTGLTLIAMQRAERRLQQNIAETGDLAWHARAGLELAIAFTEQVANWRTLAAGNSNRLFVDFPIANDTVTVQLYDDADSLLANNDAQPVRIRSTAKHGTTTCTLEAQLKARPLSALRHAVIGTSSSATMELMNSTTLRGPIRAHGHVNAASTSAAQDDAAIETMTGYTISAPAATPKTYAATALTPPQPNLTVLQSLATTITGDGGTRCDLEEYNLTPTVNPEGSANANGIYWLQAGGREVLIENLHVKGTLIITGVSQKVTIQGGLWLEPGPLQYPVLLVDCPTLQVEIIPGLTISEVTMYLTLGSTTKADLNGDGDCLDTLSSQIRGLAWINCSHLFMRNSAWCFAGCLISSAITVDAGVALDNDLTLLDVPSPGCVQSGMSLLPGSIRVVQP